MAITHVEGTVTRTFFNGKGAEVQETFTKRDGSEGKTRWAAWFEQPHGLSEGDVVKVSGLHSDEIDEWDKDGEKRRAIKRSLNKARIQGQDATSAPSVAQQPPADDPWHAAPAQPAGGDVGSTPTTLTDDTPF